MTLLASFPLLDTIEIIVGIHARRDKMPSELVVQEVKEASEILKQNQSKAEKTVLVTKWNVIWDTNRFDFDAGGPTIREVFPITA